MDYRFTLEKGSRKHPCPGCGKKTLKKYLDATTGDYLSDQVGRCDREVNCGYHQKPSEWFESTGTKPDPIPSDYKPTHQVIPQQPSFIPPDLFTASLSHYDQNNLYRFMESQFGAEVSRNAFETYQIGTSKHREGSTVFWQVDQAGAVRSGKVMQYDPQSGKRVKSLHPTWVHTLTKLDNFHLDQCLFGSHLLPDSSKPIGVTESEKTAVICSVYLPDFTWVATGGLSNLKPEKFKGLSDRVVFLFPDLGCLDKWRSKESEIEPFVKSIRTSTLLEENASDQDKQSGLDIADYLLRTGPPPKPVCHIQSKPMMFSEDTPGFWIIPGQSSGGYNRTIDPEITGRIEQIKSWFSSNQVPSYPVKLTSCQTVTDPAKFVESHLSVCETSNGAGAYMPYLERLEALKTILCPANAGI